MNRNKEFIFKKKTSYMSRKTQGRLYYLFFNDGERSYKTCVDSGFRNYNNWEQLIKNAVPGDVVRNLVVKSKGLIHADSRPIWTGKNLFEEKQNSI